MNNPQQQQQQQQPTNPYYSGSPAQSQQPPPSGYVYGGASSPSAAASAMGNAYNPYGSYLAQPPQLQTPQTQTQQHASSSYNYYPQPVGLPPASAPPSLPQSSMMPPPSSSYSHTTPTIFSTPAATVPNTAAGTRQAPYSSTPTLQSQQQQQQQQRPQPETTTTNASTTRSRLMMRPPYVDPNTKIIYDIDNPEYEGWLTKQSMWLKEWRRRYFILKGNKLFFCKDAFSGPHGMMDLAHCTTVKSADLKSKKRHSFEISTPETCYLLYADTESEKDDWIGRVGKAIVRSSRTYYPTPTTGKAASNNSRATGGGSADPDPDYYQDEYDDDIYENDDPDNPYFND